MNKAKPGCYTSSANFREYLKGISMDAWYKAAMALAFHGIKPASAVTYKGWEKDWSQAEGGLLVPEGYEGQIGTDFARLGVYGEPAMTPEGHTERMPPQDSYLCERLNVHVASSDETLAKLAAVWPAYRAQVSLGSNPNSRADPRIEKSLGELFGYPETAVEAYIGERKALPRQELERRVIKEVGCDIAPYLFFNCSEDNWKREIETAKAWAKWTLQNYPEVHAEAIQKFVPFV